MSYRNIDEAYAAGLAAGRAEGGKDAPTDDEIMRTVINGCDTLDITRVSEMVSGGWKATTIFDGDAALLRVVKAAITAALSASRAGGQGEGK